MSKSKRRELAAEEQHLLDHGHLRLLTSPDNLARCDQAIVEHHYPQHSLPQETTFTRVLHDVDDDRIEPVLLRWQDQILGPRQD